MKELSQTYSFEYNVSVKENDDGSIYVYPFNGIDEKKGIHVYCEERLEHSLKEIERKCKQLNDMKSNSTSLFKKAMKYLENKKEN